MQKLIYGKPVANKIYKDVSIKIDKLKKREIKPCIAVIIIGNRKDSITYVNMKANKCTELGISSEIHKLEQTCTETDILERIDKLNGDKNVNGILIQLPLPKHINEETILDRVSVDKDLDGFHTINSGKLTSYNNAKFIPCTPGGCFEIIKYYDIDYVGKHIVLIGGSKVVGLPMALQMLHKESTITICHKMTENIKEITKLADILIVACGVPELVKQDWIKEGVVIIDVGINSKPDSSKKKGYKLVGDVDTMDVYDKVKYITPVPYGVGPVTIAMLIKHSVDYL